jgi:hypothetical protein
MLKYLVIGVAVSLLAGGAAMAQTKKTADGKEPPACAAIKFRPVPSGMADGEQDAGLYKSRFGSIVVRANVKGGEPQDYFVVVNGKRPQAIAGGPPASVESCLKAKKIAAPMKLSTGACTGQSLHVVIDRAQSQKVLLLIARDGREWKMCSASSV